MAEHQVRSKERVRKHGEVFTAEREVKAMVDLAGEVASDPTMRTVLEPACGNGNFLVEILNRKCDRLEASGYKKNGRAGKWVWQVADLYAFKLATVLTLLYGIDILPNNVEECKKRLIELVLSRFDKVVKGKDNASRKLLENAAKTITDINIVCGDALEMTTNANAPLVFVKWRADETGDRYRFGITPYYYRRITNAADERSDLFDVLQKLDRSPQIHFKDIAKVREFVQ